MTFAVNGCSLQSARRELLDLAKRWAAATPHLASIRPDFWLLQAPGIESFLLSDRVGPIAFVKIVEIGSAAELHVMVSPRGNPARGLRTMKAMMEMLPWVEKALALRKIKTVFFKTKNPSLMAFARKRLGFEDAGLDDFGEKRMEKKL